jgi:hypothetical protein
MRRRCASSSWRAAPPQHALNSSLPTPTPVRNYLLVRLISSRSITKSPGRAPAPAITSIKFVKAAGLSDESVINLARGKPLRLEIVTGAQAKIDSPNENPPAWSPESMAKAFVISGYWSATFSVAQGLKKCKRRRLRSSPKPCRNNSQVTTHL